MIVSIVLHNITKLSDSIGFGAWENIMNMRHKEVKQMQVRNINHQ